MKQIQNLLRKITKKINGKWYGSYDSKLFGEGIEKADNRIYNSGDNANLINRKLTAKNDKIIIDKHVRESSLSLFLYFDINHNRNSGYEEPFIKTVTNIIQELNIYLSKENHYSEIYFNGTKGIEKSKYKMKEYSLLKEQLYQSKKISKPTYWESRKDFFSGLNNFLKKISNKKNNFILIFTDSFSLDKQNTNLIHYLQGNNNIHLFVLDNYKDGKNYNNFNISFPKISKGISYTLV